MGSLAEGAAGAQGQRSLIIPRRPGSQPHSPVCWPWRSPDPLTPHPRYLALSLDSTEGQRPRAPFCVQAHPPALGADAAGPACDDTVHVGVVGVVPRAVFGAYLGHKWGELGRGLLQPWAHTVLWGLGRGGHAPIVENRPCLQTSYRILSLSFPICQVEIMSFDLPSLCGSGYMFRGAGFGGRIG